MAVNAFFEHLGLIAGLMPRHAVPAAQGATQRLSMIRNRP